MNHAFKPALQWLLAVLPYLVASVWGGVLAGWGGALEASFGIALSPWLFIDTYTTFFDVYPLWVAVMFPLLYLVAFACMAAGARFLPQWWGKALLCWSYFGLSWICMLQILAVT